MKLRFIVFPALLALAGCASAPQPSVRYVDPGAQGQIAGTGVESQDIAAAAQKAAQSIVNLPVIAQATKPPIVLITPVNNRSSSPINTDIYTTKLKTILMQNAGGRVMFLARDASASANEREQLLRESGAVQDGGTADSGRVGATYDYILTAELQSISTATSAGQSDYFIVEFKLVDFQDLQLWGSSYEIKKEGRESGVYR